METPPELPARACSVFQASTAPTTGQRRSNQERLRELVASHGEEVTLLCSHDPLELEREQARADAVAAAAE